MSRIVSGAIGTVLLVFQSLIYSFLLTGTTTGELIFEAYRNRYSIEADPTPQRFWLELWRRDFLEYMAHPSWVCLPIGLLLMTYVIAGWLARRADGGTKRHRFFKKYYDLSILLLVCLTSVITHASLSENGLNTGFLLLVFLAAPYLIIRTFSSYSGKSSRSLMSIVPFGFSLVLVILAASATPLSYGYHQLEIKVHPVASLPISSREWMNVILVGSFDRPGLIDFDESELRIQFLERESGIGIPRPEGETFDLGELAEFDVSPCEAIEEGKLEILIVLLYKGVEKSATCGEDSLLAAALKNRELTMARTLLEFGHEPGPEDVSKAIQTQDRDIALRVIGKFGLSNAKHEALVEKIRPLINKENWEAALHLVSDPEPDPDPVPPDPIAPPDAAFLEAAWNARHEQISEWLGYFRERPEILRRAMLLVVSEATPRTDANVMKCLSLINSVNSDLEAADEAGNTLLVLAAGKGLLTTVEFLLDNYADVQAQNQEGKNALMAAAINGHQAVVERLLAHSPETELLEDQNGDTVLIHAARAGQMDIVRLLLTSDSDPTHRNLAGEDAKAAATNPAIRKAIWDSMNFMQRSNSHGLGHLFIFYVKADGNRFSLNVRQVWPKTSQQQAEVTLESNLKSSRFKAIGCNPREMTILYRKQGNNRIWWLIKSNSNWVDRGRIEGVELRNHTMIDGFCDSDSQMRVFYAGESGHIYSMEKAYLEDWPHRSQRNLQIRTREDPLAVGWSVSNWHLFYRDRNRRLQATSSGYAKAIPAADLPDVMMSSGVLHSNWNKLDIFYLDDAQILSWRHWTGREWEGPYSLPETGRIDSKPTATAWDQENRAVFFLRRHQRSLHLFGSIWNGATYEPPEDLGKLEAVEIAAISFPRR